MSCRYKILFENWASKSPCFPQYPCRLTSFNSLAKRYFLTLPPKSKVLDVGDINISTPFLFRSLASLSVGLLSKAFLKFSRVHLLNLDRLVDIVKNRNPGESLISYQNHASTLDDPLLWGNMPASMLVNPNHVRWSLAAREVIFLNPVLNAFFAAGQTIPVIRGAGIYQPAMDASVKLLNEGKWVNIYSEGRINKESSLLPFRWGVGRLIQETTSKPIIIPIYHSGMIKTFLGRGDYIPRTGQDIVFSIGTPIDIREFLKNDTQFQKELNRNGFSIEDERAYITRVLQNSLDGLRQETLDWMKEQNIDPGFHENK